ncbi:MAG: penicillin acylase family protein, partial [Deltaproteobacteria bacterium]|nr:penicillin acylase family protein [Deltaproteobacteria bacterium]
DGHFPVPGWTGEYEWTGTVPLEELPSSYLPAGSAEPQVTGSSVSTAPTHVIATANQRTVHADYKYPISNSWVPPYRFLRISQLLGQKEKMSVEDIQHYQADQHPLFADTLVQILEEVDEDTEDLRWALKTLREWDRQMTKDSTAATLYELTLFHLMKNTYSDELGDLYKDYAARSSGLYSGMDAIIHQPQAKWWDDVRTPAAETRKDILRRSLQDAIADARQRLGSNPTRWRWGDLHRAVFAHPMGRRWPLNWLLNRSVPYGGDGHTVNVGYYRLDQPFDVVAAPSFRMVVDLSNIAHAYAMNTTGQSGRPFTPHYGDMIEAWAEVKYHPMWMDEEDIAAHTEGTLVLTPSSGSQ